MNEDFLKINISFLSSGEHFIPKAKMFVNVNDEDEFHELKNNTICSYEKILIKIIDIQMNKEYFLFLKNSNILIKNNIANIDTFSTKQFYVSLLRKTIDEVEFKKLKKKIGKMEIKKDIGLSIDEILLLEQLKYEEYIMRMKKMFNLMEDN
ncbi:MSC_0621 family F1-like ATPase epsilon subunit [Mycoplasmopsis lipophila]|uniref:MSC_0621 family F1-like ATPase epsilon subunit n=1 Tax=Mycoplasmopsis lipophila TaxID=2117 RepID=UPI0038736999